MDKTAEIEREHVEEASDNWHPLRRKLYELREARRKQAELEWFPWPIETKATKPPSRADTPWLANWFDDYLTEIVWQSLPVKPRLQPCSNWPEELTAVHPCPDKCDHEDCDLRHLKIKSAWHDSVRKWNTDTLAIISAENAGDSRWKNHSILFDPETKTYSCFDKTFETEKEAREYINYYIRRYYWTEENRPAKYKWSRETRWSKEEPCPSQHPLFRFSWEAFFEAICLWRVDTWLEAGGQIKTLPRYEFSKRSKDRTKLDGSPRYVFDKWGENYNDALRQRAKRGVKLRKPMMVGGLVVSEEKPSDIQLGRIELGLTTKNDVQQAIKQEAQRDLDWFKYRALRQPFVPKQELAHDAHRRRSNNVWDYEDKAITKIDAIAKINQQKASIPDYVLSHIGQFELLGDTFANDYDHDYCSDEEYSPSHSEHDLVRPDFTNSLNRLFGREVDEKELTKESLGKKYVLADDEEGKTYKQVKADKDLVKAWDAFGATFSKVLRLERKGYRINVVRRLRLALRRQKIISLLGARAGMG
jgi:hypothetical protein